MKPLFAICLLLGCPGIGNAQAGLQGNITLGGNTTIALTGHSVVLTWTASQNGSSYNLYCGNAHGGPYAPLASGIVTLTYTEVQLNGKQTLYYVTTAVNGNGESGYSDEAVAVIP
ncbi:MAG: fibronectin type III domain-containing protein [Terriglobales bacterium]|jgi:hypothetical protein